MLFRSHVLVRARAGCAKTTTSLEGVKQAPERRILVAAFNKLIADEANARLVGQDRVKAKTLHALVAELGVMELEKELTQFEAQERAAVEQDERESNP